MKSIAPELSVDASKTKPSTRHASARTAPSLNSLSVKEIAPIVVMGGRGSRRAI